LHRRPGRAAWPGKPETVIGEMLALAGKTA